MIDPREPNPEEIRLTQLVTLAEKRVASAAIKQRIAERETSDALDALEAAQARLVEWLAANPDPQGDLLSIGEDAW